MKINKKIIKINTHKKVSKKFCKKIMVEHKILRISLVLKQNN